MSRLFTASLLVMIVAGSGIVNAGRVTLGTSGWEAVWDTSLDPYVSIIYDYETAEALYIQKSAEFIQGPGLDGLFPAIPITFRQVGPSTISQIVILDEIITNSTGVDWTDFPGGCLTPPHWATRRFLQTIGAFSWTGSGWGPAGRTPWWRREAHGTRATVPRMVSW